MFLKAAHRQVFLDLGISDINILSYFLVVEICTGFLNLRGWERLLRGQTAIKSNSSLEKIERRKYKSEFKKIILRATNGIEDK